MTIISDVFTYKTPASPVDLSKKSIDSKLKPSEVLVDTKFVSLNPIDLKLKSISFVPWNYYTVRDFSGLVIAAGNDAISKFPLGSKVCGVQLMGSGTVGSVTKLDTKKHAVMHQPETVTGAEAAALPSVFGAAYNMTRSCTSIGAESSALVLGGATSVGSLVIQLLKKEYQVDRVIATCSPESSKFVQSLGANSTIDYKSPDFQENLIEAAGSEKFHNIFDCVGGYDALEISDNILQRSTLGSSYITCAGDSPFTGSYSQAMMASVSSWPRMIFRSIFGNYYGIQYKFAMLNNKTWPDIGTKLIDKYQIRVPIDSKFSAVDAQAAFAHLDSGKVNGKVVLEF